MKDIFHNIIEKFLLKLREVGERKNLAKHRQTKVWKKEKPDKWPILMYTNFIPEELRLINKVNDLNYENTFYNKEKMLIFQLKKAISTFNNSDVIPSIRANMGTGIILACINIEQEVFPDKMPWIKQHLSKKQISSLRLDDMFPRGSFKRGLEMMKFFKEILSNELPVYLMDHQGPFDLAHLLYGDQIFIEIYDDPKFVHYLLQLCVDISIKCIKIMKKTIGESLNRLYHSNAIYAENMGIRICEDTSSLLGPKHIDEFVIPYTQQLAKEFGGAWVHYCGRNDYLTEAVLSLPEIRGINFGFIPGRKEHIFEEEMRRCLNSGKIYFGTWPLEKEENSEEYLVRLYKWASQGVLLPVIVDEEIIKRSKLFKNSEEILDFWYSL